jgi:hypothetical protein
MADKLYDVAWRYADRAERLAAIRESIGRLNDEADEILAQQEGDERTLRTAMTACGAPLVRVRDTTHLILETMTGRVRVTRAVFASDLKLPTDPDTAEADALLALNNAIEAEADEAAAWCKVRVLPGEAVSA